MCCTFTESEMSKTRIYVGEAQKDGKLVHVLAYQNTAITKGPNAMVLPFPTDVEMGSENVINTRDFKNFLEDITNASRQYTKGFSRRGLTLGADSFSLAEVFDVGSYTVILADNVWQIPEALSRVAENKRPNVSSDFLVGYEQLYPDQPIAVCCWNGSIEAEPLMWWYEPRDKEKFFIPTMDAHDGKAPKVGALTSYDHIVSVGSHTGSELGHKVKYSQAMPAEVKALLPYAVYASRVPDISPNGDHFVKTSLLHPTKEQFLGIRDCFPAVELVNSQLFKGRKFSSVMDGWT